MVRERCGPNALFIFANGLHTLIPIRVYAFDKHKNLFVDRKRDFFFYIIVSLPR